MVLASPHPLEVPISHENRLRIKYGHPGDARGELGGELGGWAAADLMQPRMNAAALLRGREQPAAHCERDQLGAAGNLQLAHDVLPVGLNRSH